MSQSKTIVLQGPIEFLIFNQEIITLFVDQTSFISGHIADRTKDTLLIQLDTHDPDMLINSLGKEILVSSNYRSKRLEFSITIIEHEPISRVITTSVPHQGQLINHRQWERTCFDSESRSLRAEIVVDTMQGKRLFESCHLCEFSYQTLSLFVDRKQGLIFPNDFVDSVTIKSNRDAIFHATGKVTRIEKNEVRNDNMFVVIRLDDPNAKPILDIEPNKRHSDRFKFENKTDAFIEFIHPFSQSKKVAQLLDISNSGVSIVLQGSKFAMPPGLVIENVSMQLPMHARLDIKLRVKGYYQEMPNDEDLKVSMEFIDASAMLVKEVSSYVQHLLSNNLQDATYEDIDELWQFYFETGFIYEGKRRQLSTHTDAVRKTLRLLLKSNTPLLKKILYKEDDVIKGHVTAIKVFDNALMVQHLNALKTNSGSAAMQVIRGITSYFLDKTANFVSGNRYVCFYYRPDNMYPALVFGETTKLIDNDEICWTETYQFCLPTENRTLTEDDDIEVFEANVDDLSDLETLLIWNNDYRISRLEGLAREMITEMKISNSYERIGLYRYRKVFVAKMKSTGQTVYAVCNYASPGLNFSELTNSIKLFYDANSTANTQILIDAVCSLALESYQATELHSPVLLLRANQPIPSSFVLEKNYTLWAIDLVYAKKFKDATEHIFANLKEFVRKKKAV